METIILTSVCFIAKIALDAGSIVSIKEQYTNQFVTQLYLFLEGHKLKTWKDPYMKLLPAQFAIDHYP